MLFVMAMKIIIILWNLCLVAHVTYHDNKTDLFMETQIGQYFGSEEDKCNE